MGLVSVGVLGTAAVGEDGSVSLPATSGRLPRMTLTDEGPLLIEGAVEFELPDGSVVRSERPVTALCTCRRSKRYPFCDTSHRRKLRAPRSSDKENSA